VTDPDMHWLAGLVEGEGSFSWHAPRKHHKGQVRIQVSMTDLDVLQRAQSVAACGHIQGPYVYKRKNGSPAKPIWNWAVQKQGDVRDLMADLYPMMGARRQAKIIECVGLMQ